MTYEWARAAGADVERLTPKDADELDMLIFRKTADLPFGDADQSRVDELMEKCRMNAHRRPLFIALCAPAMGCGKSAIAQHLVDNHDFTLLKFASGLKSMTRALLAELGEDHTTIEARINGNLKEHVIPALQVTSRQLQQRIGHEFGRLQLHENVWADILRTRAAGLIAAGHSVVVDDMRYLNELEAVRWAGGIPIRVVRPGATITAAHSSEGELNATPMTVLNNSEDLDALFRLVDHTIAYLRDEQF